MFSEDFLWGAATAAHQIEGAAEEGGRGPSIWDTYAKDKRIDPATGRGNVLNGDTAEVACDHYHRFKEDVALMKEMGLKAYRFSISWSRVLPEGRGRVNEEGLRFYNDLTDELTGAGIEPCITLFHWDLPQALQDIGGWANPEMPDIFAEYVKLVTEALSDRVSYWITLNEPQCHIIIGHLDGICAPKVRASCPQVFSLMHNLFLAHGKAVRVIRQYAKKKPKVGYAPNPLAFYPYRDTQEDKRAACRKAFDADNRNLWSSTWWMDPILLGKYPEDGVKAFGEDFPKEMIKPGDMDIIAQPLDFIGCNFYQGNAVRMGENGTPLVIPKKTGFARTALKWEVTPEILKVMPEFIHERYGLPILITENGLSMTDWVALDGKVHDPQRIDFMKRYLRELDQAIEEGTPVLGYFAWSLLDNYEWSEGYGERFGMIHVDFESQKRTRKDSFYWYSEVIRSQGRLLYED